MDQSLVSRRTNKKRKLLQQEDDENLSLDDILNQDLLERVLSRLPTSIFFRFRSVCKRWSSIAASESFKLACSQIPSRDPWLFMADSNLDQSVVFDTCETNWKHPPLLLQHNHHTNNLIPVAASGGVICFRSTTRSGAFFVSNPLTGACRELPPLPPTSQNQTIHAVSLNSSPKNTSSSYRLVLVSGDLPNLFVTVYESGRNCWEEESKLSLQMEDGSHDSGVGGGDEVLYFLSKAGDVVATNMQRSPSKQYYSVVAVKDGEEIIYFLSSSGTVLACNLVKKSFFEYPRLLPACFEYSIDVVECRGEMSVVVLSDFLESASLRVWRFSEEEKDRSWRQIAAMPPSMSHELYGKKADINCVSCGYEKLMVCVNSGESSRYWMCDLEANQWTELPKCVVDGKPKEFMSAFSFEPRIEASV